MTPDPMAAPLTWQALLAEEKTADYFQSILRTLALAYQRGETIYPPRSRIFHAFSQTPFASVKVVILGQDPYHGPNQAHGLAFSVPVGVALPPSLQNIYRALAQDSVEFTKPAHGCLEAWARQGVLLLNTALTVSAGQAHSHAALGWERFTDKVISVLNAYHPSPIVFLLWGRHAQQKQGLITQQRHCILRAPHPSPLSAHRGFITCQHFSQANRFLSQRGIMPIQWSLPAA